MNSLGQLSFPTLSDHDYEKQLPSLQRDLARLQIALFLQKKRAVIVFEGTDAAGKGGAIRRMIQTMDPRAYRVYPIGPPTEYEAERHYQQRFWQRLPKNGELAIFDRSWYGRVLAERVEKLATEKEWRRAYHEINNFERLLSDDGVIIIKMFLHISKEEQRERFIRRWENPDKQWKLTSKDLDAHNQYHEYIEAFDEMLDKTSQENREWNIIPANNKNYARISTLTKTIEVLSKTIHLTKVEKPSKQMQERIRALEQEDQ